jgi:hypothetical protein
MDFAERVLKTLVAIAAVSYAVSTLFLRDYWSALSSAVLALVLAIIVVERRCRRWCRQSASQTPNSEYTS